MTVHSAGFTMLHIVTVSFIFPDMGMLIYKEEENNTIPHEDGFETVFETDTTCVVKVIY